METTKKIGTDRGPSSDNIIIKKMRLIRGLSRNEAALIFDYSRSSIEKIENGRAHLTQDKIQKFVEGYGFSMNQFMDLKFGKSTIVKPEKETKKIKIIEHKHLRRSYQKKITKEVQVIARLRKRRKISQYKASELCGWHKTAIGHIEQGRIELTKKKLDTLLEALGYSHKHFNKHLCSEIDRESIEQLCFNLIQEIDDSKLANVQSILQSFAS